MAVLFSLVKTIARDRGWFSSSGTVYLTLWRPKLVSDCEICHTCIWRVLCTVGSKSVRGTGAPAEKTGCAFSRRVAALRVRFLSCSRSCFFRSLSFDTHEIKGAGARCREMLSVACASSAHAITVAEGDARHDICHSVVPVPVISCTWDGSE